MPRPILTASALARLERISLSAQLDSGTHTGSRAGASFSRTLTGTLVAGTGDTRVSESLRAAEASHRLYAPLTTDVATGDVWTCAGRVYDVVWAPLPTALDVDRMIGLKEVR